VLDKTLSFSTLTFCFLADELLLILAVLPFSLSALAVLAALARTLVLLVFSLRALAVLPFSLRALVLLAVLLRALAVLPFSLRALPVLAFSLRAFLLLLFLLWRGAKLAAAAASPSPMIFTRPVAVTRTLAPESVAICSGSTCNFCFLATGTSLEVKSVHNFQHATYR
jgi:hypothetical protein